VHDLTRTAGTTRIYIWDNTAAWVKVYDAAGAPANPFDFSASVSLTSGQNYRIKITSDGGGGTGTLTAHYIGVEQANGVTYPSLATLNDSTTPTAANLAAINDAQEYLRNIAEVGLGSDIAACVYSAYTGATLYTRIWGGFMYTGQTSLKVLSRWQFGTASITITRDAGTDSGSLTVSAAEVTDTIALTGGSYTVGKVYGWEIQHTNSSGTINYNQNYVKRVYTTGNLSFTTNPYYFTHGDNVNGSTGTPRLKPVGGSGASDNPAELKLKLEMTTPNVVPYGVQWCAPIAFGAVTISTVEGYSFGTGGVASFTHAHQFRYLHYLPTASGASGQIAFGSTTQALADSASGGWNVLDLESVTGLAYGQVMSISDVSACFELQTA
jgi:hypothetical protein